MEDKFSESKEFKEFLANVPADEREEMTQFAEEVDKMEPEKAFVQCAMYLIPIVSKNRNGRLEQGQIDDINKALFDFIQLAAQRWMLERIIVLSGSDPQKYLLHVRASYSAVLAMMGKRGGRMENLLEMVQEVMEL